MIYNMNNPKPKKIYNNDIKVLGRIVSIASENKVATAEQIFDEKFKYNELPDYSFDNENIDPTQKGLNQYSINRLIGKKVKNIEDNGLVPDENGYLGNIKANNITVGNKLTTKDLEVTNNARINNLVVGPGEGIDVYGALTHLLQCCANMNNQGGSGQSGLSLTVSPNPINISNIGDTVEFTVTPNVSGVDLVVDPVVDYTASIANNAIATLIGNNKVKAVSGGTTQLTVSWNNIEKTVQINVTRPQVEPDPTLYTITYMDDTSIVTTEDYEAGATIDPLHGQDPLTKEGYTFAGWSGMPSDMKMPANDITVIAQWTQNEQPVDPTPQKPEEQTYTITFKDCSPEHNFTIGDNSFDQYAVVVDTQTYHAGDTVTPPNEAAVKAALTSAGASWSRPYDNLVGWNNLPYGQIMPAEDITVYAIWEVHQENPTAGYRLVIKPDFSNQSDVDPDWYQDGNEYVLHHGGTGLVTLWAQNTEDPTDEYTVSGSWSSNRNTVSFTSAQGTYCNFTDTGSDVSDPTTFTITASHPNFENATFTVKLMPAIKYTLTFDTNGGSAIAPVQYRYGETISPVTPPTKSGMIFNGWSPAIPATMPRSNVTVTAQWDTNQNYSIAFDHDQWTIYTKYAHVDIGVTQADGYPEDIIWTSSDTSVATVEPANNYGTQDGRVYAIGSGTATITATGATSGVTKTATITVSLLTLSNEEITIVGNDTAQLPTAYVDGTEVTPTSWTSSDTSVARIQNGMIMGGTPGICNLEAYYSPGGHSGTYRAYCRVIVKANASDNVTGTKVVVTPRYVSLNKAGSTTITTSTNNVDLSQYEWQLSAYPNGLVTINPSVDNTTCTVTAGNTAGFATLFLQPIDATNLDGTENERGIEFDSLTIEVLQ